MIIKENCCMAEYCSFKAGGNVKTLYVPENLPELKALISDLNAKGEEFILLGRGSNTLFADGNHNLSVILISKAFCETEINGLTVKAGAGCSLGMLATKFAENGLSGFEFASGIPGSLGGAIYMNAGAYNHEIAECIISVISLDKSGNEIVRSNSECKFAYRNSIYKENGETIIGAVLKLNKSEEADIKTEMQRLNSARKEKQPLEYPSAGSFFKRPKGYFAAKLIEDSGCKGLSVGGAQVSEKHAGFIINKDNATAADIINLSRRVCSIVQQKCGVTLETEVRIIGEKL